LSPTLAAARRLEGIGLVVLSGCSFATLGIFNRLAGARGVNVLTVLSLRFGLAALCLWVLVLPRHPVRLSGRKALGFFAMGALFVVEAGLFFVSSRLIPVALTSLLLYLYPGLVMLLAWALRGDRPGRSGLLALALALAGIALAVGSPAHALNPLGVTLGLCSSLGYAVYMFIGGRLQRGIPPLVATAWISTCAAVIFLALGLATGGLHPLQAMAAAWAPILGLAILGTVVPVFTLMAGLARITATQASIASTVEPIATAVMGALFLHEGLQGLQIFGGILVLLAVLLLSAGDRAAPSGLAS
jgi:drug/metabolite transporter (DMT)-like permease